MEEKVVYDSLECILKMLETIMFMPELMRDGEIKNKAHLYIQSVIEEIHEVQDENNN